MPASSPCSDGGAITIGAAPIQSEASPDLDVLILGGRPIREPVAWMGPFVMNTRDEVLQAVADYQAGRLGSIPAVHGAPDDRHRDRSPGLTLQQDLPDDARNRSR